MKQLFVHILVLCCLSTAVVQATVSGIAVTAKCPQGSTKGDAWGSVWKFVVRNGVSDYPGTQLHEGPEAGQVCINTTGTTVAFMRKNRAFHAMLCVMDVDGGNYREIIELIDGACLDFPTEHVIYFVHGGSVKRVDISGDGPYSSENVMSAPNGATYSISGSGTRGAVNSYNQGATTFGDISFSRSGCGASISTSGRYFTNNTSSHTDMYVFDLTTRQQIASFSAHNFGYMEQEYWNTQDFAANSDEWLCFKQGYGYLQGDGARQVLYRRDGTDPIEIQPYEAGVFYENGDFWVGDVGATGAVVSLAPTTLQFTAESPAVAPPAQSVSVSNGGDGELGAISVEDDAEWLTVTVDGTTLTNTVDPSGLDGEYEATVTVSAANAAQGRPYTVSLTVLGAPYLARLSVRDDTVAVGESATFAAVGFDQFDEMYAVESIEWSTTGGTITQQGRYTAGSVVGEYTVRAQAGDVVGTATVTVVAAVAEAPLEIIAPNGAEAFATGQEITLSWHCRDATIPKLTVKMSNDGGENWTVLSTDEIVAARNVSDTQGSWTFAIPDSLEGRATPSSACLLLIQHYFDQEVLDVSDGMFTVTDGSSVVRRTAQPRQQRGGEAAVMYLLDGRMTRARASGRPAASSCVIIVDEQQRTRSHRRTVQMP